MTEFDYLVVGGGTAGCIVAARLAEDPATPAPAQGSSQPSRHFHHPYHSSTDISGRRTATM